MSKTKMVLRVSTWKAKAGDTIEVDADVADALEADRKAFRATPKKQADAKPDA